ncbi:hypothetical protein LWI28_014912 [Acer negundo]|uniref:Uncharacterized protein n=1 Tax=Acer negundo TaxID=4023 RepID=A0AAD5NQ89_ACENE|nr:hypothetical protein LWI28_014912 [Acer negundo]
MEAPRVETTAYITSICKNKQALVARAIQLAEGIQIGGAIQLVRDIQLTKTTQLDLAIQEVGFSFGVVVVGCKVMVGGCGRWVWSDLSQRMVVDGFGVTVVSREQQSKSVNAIPIVPISSAVIPVSMDIGFDLSLDLSAGQVVPYLDSLVQTVFTTVGLSSLQCPPIPYDAHWVRKDYYRSSQIPSSVGMKMMMAVGGGVRDGGGGEMENRNRNWNWRWFDWC